MLISKTVEVRLRGSKLIQYYKEKGYEIPTKINKNGKEIIDFDKSIIVKVEDLTSSSNATVEVLCDYCKKIVLRLYSDYYKRKLSEDSTPNKKDCCYDCRSLKKQESDLLIYGVSHTTQLDSTKQKMRETCLEKYGVEVAVQSDVVKTKIQKTNLERYGVTSTTVLPEVILKRENTCLQKYGVKHPVQNEKILEKIHKTLFSNGNAVCSKQQTYLHNLIGGILNYPFKRYLLDIALIQDKICIEYDGSGHDLSVLLGIATRKEFVNKDIKRNYTLTYNGWKVITIVSKKDYLPNDSMILTMITKSKKYLASGHSWIKFDIDNSKVITSQFENHFEFGKLRKIKDKDLEEVS